MVRQTPDSPGTAPPFCRPHRGPDARADPTMAVRWTSSAEPARPTPAFAHPCRVDLPISGPLLRPRLLAAGVTDDELRRLLRTGELTALQRGAYAARADPKLRCPEDRHALLVAAAVPRVAPDAVVSHVSAAVMFRPPSDVVVAEKRREDAMRAELRGLTCWTWGEIDAVAEVAKRLPR